MSEEIDKVDKIKKHSIFSFVFLTIITLGLYYYYWLFSNYSKLNDLVPDSRNKIGLGMLVTLFILWLLSLVCVFSMPQNEHSSYFNSIYDALRTLSYLFSTIISLKSLRLVELYAKEKYNINLQYSIVLCVIFGLLYVVFSLKNYKEDIQLN